MLMIDPDAQTPPDLVKAVERRFGVTVGFDICCTSKDCIAVIEQRVKVDADCNPDPHGEHYVGKRSLFGYFFDHGVNALQQDWRTIEQEVAWIFPPDDPRLWVLRCLTDKPRVFMLALAEPELMEMVNGLADVYFLVDNEQLSGHMLLDFGACIPEGRSTKTEEWNWLNDAPATQRSRTP